MSFNLRAFLRSRFTREGAVGLYLTVAFLICAALVALFASLADEVFEPGGTLRLDREITYAVRGFQTPTRVRFAIFVTNLGSPLVIFPATAIIAGVLWGRHRHVSGLLFAGAVVLGGLLESVLKIVFHRGRPDLWPALVTERTPSFPSGHATLATVFWGGLVAVVFHQTRSRRRRLIAIAVAVPMLLAIAVSRVYLGAHWASDIFAGILVGLFWVVVCWTGTEYIARRRAARAPG
jgi:membrane-associated phospholipid phosphatase